jgi:ABC-type phosphate/phosphonate transport system ATPase subunit
MLKEIKVLVQNGEEVDILGEETAEKTPVRALLRIDKIYAIVDEVDGGVSFRMANGDQWYAPAESYDFWSKLLYQTEGR